MIHLSSVAKTAPGSGLRDRTIKVVLQPTTLSLPADRRVAVLGEDQSTNTMFLRLLARAEAPTHGKVIASARVSPVVRPGRLFHPSLSVLENIQFFARMLNVDANQLARAVSFFAGADIYLESAAEALDRRIALETALLSILPYDCYLVDELARLRDAAKDCLVAAATQRQAGIIFTTGKPRLALELADCAVVIRNGIVHPFSEVEEAIAFHGR
jgi:ABC-type polysaccharide/polyol phosphate transport system ATPase subunit